MTWALQLSWYKETGCRLLAESMNLFTRKPAVAVAEVAESDWTDDVDLNKYGIVLLCMMIGYIHTGACETFRNVCSSAFFTYYREVQCV